MFKAVLITLLISPQGEVIEHNRTQHATVQECELHKYQKEFTDAPPYGYPGIVFLCEWN